MKRPVLFVHGMWCRPGVWTEWLRAFEAAGYDGTAIALPGHADGDCDADLAGLGIADYVDAVVRTASTLERPVLVGHSMGGLVVQLAAARTEVAALVLVNSAAPAPVFPLRPKMLPGLARHFATWGLWRNAFRINRWEAAYLLLGGLPVAERPAILDGLIGESGLIAYELGFGSFNLSRTNYVDRAAICAPMLALAGVRDRIIPIDVSRAMARYYGKAMTLREYPRGAHWLLGEPEFATRIAEVLRWLEAAL